MDEFSNNERNVFLINCDRMIDRGALMSRYSRTKELDIRQLWEKEFAADKERGEKFYERIFLEYGDESVAELVTAQVGIQNVSNVMSKIIEEGRIGLSYLEKSSRYVSYREKTNGKYLYLSPEKTGIPRKFHTEYEQLNDRLFETYSRTLSEVQDYVRENYPIEKSNFLINGKTIKYGESSIPEDSLRKAYESSVRSRALDEARLILPSSTLTNIGLSGNARAFSHLLERLRYTSTVEGKLLYQELITELRLIFPKLIENVENIHGRENIVYLRELKQFLPVKPIIRRNQNNDLVKLMGTEKEEDVVNKVVTSYFFERTEGLYHDILRWVSALRLSEKREILSKISDLRKNRRNKPDRSLEHVAYTFEVNTNFGAFRDMQRHRTLTLQRKLLTSDYGYEIPSMISKMDETRKEFVEVLEESNRLFKRIATEDSTSAQYVTVFAHKYPSIVTMNLRELVYFTDLRSTPQAHFDLRKISWEMCRLVSEAHPSFIQFFKFLNTSKEELGRLNAELRKEVKTRSMKT